MRNKQGQFINQNRKIEIICKFCHCKFTDFISNNRSFCSRLCQNTWLARNKNGMKNKILTNFPSYSSVHKWLYRRLNKEHKCTNCSKETKWTDWASLSHSFKRNIEDYIELCRSCHNRFDRGTLAL